MDRLATKNFRSQSIIMTSQCNATLTFPVHSLGLHSLIFEEKLSQWSDNCYLFSITTKAPIWVNKTLLHWELWENRYWWRHNTWSDVVYYHVIACASFSFLDLPIMHYLHKIKPSAGRISCSTILKWPQFVIMNWCQQFLIKKHRQVCPVWLENVI